MAAFSQNFNLNLNLKQMQQSKEITEERTSVIFPSSVSGFILSFRNEIS